LMEPVSHDCTLSFSFKLFTRRTIGNGYAFVYWLRF
jgi:hypothetical protein